MFVVFLLVVCSDCKVPRGRKPEKGPRVWHLTETETDCGNFTSLYRDEKPSELCNEVCNVLYSMEGINQPGYINNDKKELLD